MNADRTAALTALALVLGGCASSEKGQVAVPYARAISGENREWWDVYSVEFQGDRKVRTHVGHLYRKFGPENPKGTYFLKDRGQRDVGFILSENLQAYYLIPPAPGMVEPRAQPAGTSDLHGGIKKILQVPGTVELDKVIPGAAAASP